MPKRLCVAAIIEHHFALVLGRRGKGPNRGMWVCPGGGVEDGESLEQALVREVKEETGLTLQPPIGNRFEKPYVVELSDRVILFVRGGVDGAAGLSATSDLEEVRFVSREQIDRLGGVVIPGDISEPCRWPLAVCGLYPSDKRDLVRPKFETGRFA